MLILAFALCAGMTTTFIVQLISNYAGYDLGTKALRWSQKDTEFIEIDRPKIVENYNAHMAGVIFVICYRKQTE